MRVMVPIALLMLGAHLTALVCLLVVMRRRRRTAAPCTFAPRVAILKPLKGLDECIEENLASFFRLDYPDFEIHFGVAEDDDPVIHTVRRLMALNPGIPCRLVVGGQDPSLANPKVRTLVRLLEDVRTDFVLVSDSNVCVAPDYLRRTMSEFGDPCVGIVTNIISGVGEESLGATLENLHLDGFIASAQALSDVAAHLTPVIGKSMALRLAALRDAGGLEPLSSYLAEDYLLGRKIVDCGYRVVLQGCTVDNHNERTGIYAFLDRHYRWLGMRWRINPGSCLLEMATIPTPWMVGWALAWPSEAPVAIGFLALFGMLDIVRAHVVRDSRPLPVYALLLKPVKDLCHLLVLVTSLWNDRVNWRGHVYRLHWGSRITPLPVEARKALPPFLFPMRMGDEWPSVRATWVARSHGSAEPLSPNR